MNKPLLGKKIAVLVANGFSERDLTLTQKALAGTGADMRIVSMDQGLVNSWNEDGWGLNYATDQVLSQALAADYDMLIVPGGERSVQKLELTAHTRRFIGSFIDTGKIVAFYEDALGLLLFSERVEGLNVAGPEAYRARFESAGAVWCDDDFVVSGHVMTGLSDHDHQQSYAEKVGAFLLSGCKNSSETDREPVAA